MSNVYFSFVLDSKYRRDKQSQITQSMHHLCLAYMVQICFSGSVIFWRVEVQMGWEVAVFGGTTGEYAECYAPNLNSCHFQNYKRCLNYTNIDWALSPKQSWWQFAMVSVVSLIPQTHYHSLTIILFPCLYYPVYPIYYQTVGDMASLNLIHHIHPIHLIHTYNSPGSKIQIWQMWW